MGAAPTSAVMRCDTRRSDSAVRPELRPLAGDDALHDPVADRVAFTDRIGVSRNCPRRPRCSSSQQSAMYSPSRCRCTHPRTVDVALPRPVAGRLQEEPGVTERLDLDDPLLARCPCAGAARRRGRNGCGGRSACEVRRNGHGRLGAVAVVDVGGGVVPAPPVMKMAVS